MEGRVTAVPDLRVQLEAAIARRDAAAGSDRDPAMARVSGSLLTQLGRQTDAALGRYTEADNQVQALTHRISLAEQRAQDAARTYLFRVDVDGATHVRTRVGWHKVLKVNAKSVRVATGYSWTDRITFDQILEVRTIGVQS